VQGLHGTFQVIQDDLLHPILGGNKLRKLDALLPALQESGTTDVVRPLLLPPSGLCLAERKAARCKILQFSQHSSQDACMHASSR
jgi:hypothetical protein